MCLFVIFCFLTLQISSFLFAIFLFLTLQISFLFVEFRFLTLQISLDFVFVSRNDLHSQYYPMCICIRQYHQLSGLRLWSVFRRRNVVMEIDVRWVSRGRRDVVYYHKWMRSHNFFDFGVRYGSRWLFSRIYSWIVFSVT
jgi:hypothetical protein